MSGGVDSSVAACLLMEQGFECVGVTMRLYDNEALGLEHASTCCSVDDIEDARAVAARLGMPYLTLNMAEDFKTCVMDKFIREYERGNTPNPCIDCNRYMKFERLLHRASELGCDYIATGHYVQRVETENGFALRKAADLSKDQSYVLYNLTQAQLERTLFPLGGLTKAEVRAIAEKYGFINAKKHDSQDICFVPDGDYLAFMERATGKKSVPGDLIDREGRVLGTHRGAAGYTIGQRRGLGVAADRPLYVRSKDMAANTVTVDYEESLYSSALTAEDWNWITMPEAFPFRGAAKVRYRQAEEPATVEVLENGGVRLVFDRPQRAITTGQAAVLYDGNAVLGGGTIVQAR